MKHLLTILLLSVSLFGNAQSKLRTPTTTNQITLPSFKDNKLTITVEQPDFSIQPNWKDSFDIWVKKLPTASSKTIYSERSAAEFGPLIADGFTDNYTTLQKAIDSCIILGVRRLIIPKGKYNYSKQLIVRKKDGGFVTLEIVGESSFWDAEHGTHLNFTGTQTFGIGIQKGKGCAIKKIKLTGQFTPPFGASTAEFYALTFDKFIDGKCRDNRYSPYSGIVIDPFGSIDLQAEDKYPGLSAYYTATDVSGSTGTQIEDVDIRNFVCGIISSPNGYTLNAELTFIDKIQFQDVKTALVSCQAQEKGNVMSRVGCWGGTYQIFSVGEYGAKQGSNWTIEKVNLAGLIVKFCYINVGDWFSIAIKEVYAESIGRFGSIECGSDVAISVRDCHFDFALPEYTGKNLELIYSTGKGVHFTDCVFRYYGVRGQTMNINSDALFSHVSFNSPIINRTYFGEFYESHTKADYKVIDNNRVKDVVVVPPVITPPIVTPPIATVPIITPPVIEQPAEQVVPKPTEQPIGGARYFISPFGNDNNDGRSIDKPWQSLSKISSYPFGNGDRVSLLAGQYHYGVINPGSSNITVDRYGDGHDPIIAPLQKVTLVNDGGNIWKGKNNLKQGLEKYSSPYLYVVLVNGYPVYRGQSEWMTGDKVDGGLLQSQFLRGKNYADNNTQLYFNFADWSTTIVGIKAHEGSRIDYTAWDHGVETGRPFKIMNNREFINSFGKWYSKGNDFFINLDDPNKYTVQIPTDDYSVFVNNQSNITFRRLKFVGGNYSGGYVTGSSTNITFDSIEVEFTGAHGFKTNKGTAKTTIKNSVVKHIQEHGVFSEGNNDVLDNVTFIGLGLQQGQGKIGGDGASNFAVYSTGDDVYINNCFADSLGYIGFASYGRRGLIENSRATNFSYNRSDASAFYSYMNYWNAFDHTMSGLFDWPPTKIFRNNIARNGATIDKSGVKFDPENPKVHGYYMDDRCKNILLENNVADNITGEAFFLHNTQNIVLRGNTAYNCFYGFRTSQDDMGPRDFNTRNLTITNNKFIAKTATQNLLTLASIREAGLGDDLGQQGVIDGNYYAKPVGNVDSSFLAWYRTPTESIKRHTNFDGFRQSYPMYERSGTFSTVSGNGEQIILTNQSSQPVTKTIEGTWVDVITKQTYTNTVTIPATGAIVLMKTN